MNPLRGTAGQGASGALLEVVVRHERDVPGADEGGADRLHLEDADGLSPAPALVSAVCRESEVPVRVRLRLSDSMTTTGGEMARLVGLVESYRAAGAEGVVLGFLDDDLEIDRELCTHLAEALGGLPWTLADVVDATLEPDRTWRRLRGLPGLDTVGTAGSPRGMDEGLDDLLALLREGLGDPRLVLAGDGVRPEHVPWLARAGVRQFQVATQVRPGGSWDKAYVDPGLVRSWRLLLDDAVAAAEGATPTGRADGRPDVAPDAAQPWRDLA